MSTVIPTDCHSLLTIYRSDLDTAVPSENDDLVLFQLPDQIDLMDLPGSRLVASTPTQQACWINETKGVSYAVSRVETSNAYIMIKPSAERPTKKVKHSMRMQQVQLLQRGGSGASFLELKEHPLNVEALHALLKQHVLDPFDPICRWKGLSVNDLALPLQVSEKQLMAGLAQLNALVLTNRYGLLSEEGLTEAQASIVATLTEVEKFHDFLDIEVEDFVRQAVTRTEEKYEYLPEVIRHTLLTLKKDDDQSNIKISLDVTKVAQCVVHRVFRKQGIWDTNHLLIEWQLHMPGVHHKVGVHMLQGIAISLQNDKWMYVANMTILERLGHLFTIKDGWSKAELVSQIGGDEWINHCQLITNSNGDHLFHIKREEF